MTSLAQEEPLLKSQHLAHPKYRPDIDGLRAIAVTSVVAFHAFPSLVPGGFIGVDIFFVISGFLISSIIYGSLDRQSFSFAEFYARRIKRIFPALILVLFSCYVFGWFTLFADEMKQLGKHIGGGAGFISNILLWDESGYFDTSAEVKPLLHLWSLGIEEQFYIFWPLIAWAAWKIRANPIFVVIIAASASFTWNTLNISSDATSVFYMPYTRTWELLIGSGLAYASMYRTDYMLQRAKIRDVASLVGAGAIACGFYVITSESAFPGWWALVPCIGAALIIGSGPSAWLNKHVLSFRPMVWIGLISFPLYLWHWPLLTFARIIESETPPAEVRLAAVGAATILAWVTYRFLEKPLRTSKSALKTPVMLILMAAIGIAGYITFLNNGLPDRSAAKSAERFNSQFVGPIWKYTQNDICRKRYPFDEADSYGWWFCIANKDQSPELLLLGNSFANHLFPGLASEEETKDNSILSIGACPPEMGNASDTNEKITTSPCSGDRAYRQKLLINNIIETSGTIKHAILDGMRPKVDEAYIKQVDERISYLEGQGIKVIVNIPHITVGRDLKGCFARPLKSKADNCVLDIKAKDTIDEGFAPLIEKISATHPNVKFFDQNKVFCGSTECSLTIDGMPIFRDHYNHYSEYASNQVAKAFIKWASVNEPGILQ
ncbi:acyltransferase family protein [Pseudomonas hunanensis]|uniref:acyltransferase family protein n=1 Tax=Pseudomonas hunanensis TaxID=1247546 RepID=UPI003D02DEFF